MTTALEKLINYVASGYVIPGYVEQQLDAIEYAATGVSRLTNQFQQSEKLRSLLFAILSPLDEIKQILVQLKNERWIDTAAGKQLDGAGYIVGESRKGRDDDAYRQAIKFRIFINISKATPPDLIQALRFVTQPSDIQYLENWPATFHLFTNGFGADSAIAGFMQDLSPAAITNVDVAVSYGEKPLRLSDDQDESELGGLVAPVWNCIDGRTLKTISGKRIRLRANYQVFRTPFRLTGLFDNRP